MSDGGFGYSSSNTPYSGDPAANSFVQSQVPSSSVVVTGAGGGNYAGIGGGTSGGSSYTGGTGHQSASDASNASVVTGAGGGDAATGGHQNSLATANAAFNAGVNVGHAIGSGSAGGTPTGSAASDFHAGMAALPGDIAAVNAMSAIPRDTLMSHQDWSGAGGSGYDGYLRYMASGGQVDNPVRVAALVPPPPQNLPVAQPVEDNAGRQTEALDHPKQVTYAETVYPYAGGVEPRLPGMTGDRATATAEVDPALGGLKPTPLLQKSEPAGTPLPVETQMPEGGPGIATIVAPAYPEQSVVTPHAPFIQPGGTPTAGYTPEYAKNANALASGQTTAAGVPTPQVRPGTPNLKAGSTDANSGGAVTPLQQQLVNAGYLKQSQVDGVFGRETAAAVRKMEADPNVTISGNRLKRDAGVAGPQVATALRTVPTAGTGTGLGAVSPADVRQPITGKPLNPLGAAQTPVATVEPLSPGMTEVSRLYDPNGATPAGSPFPAPAVTAKTAPTPDFSEASGGTPLKVLGAAGATANRFGGDTFAPTPRSSDPTQPAVPAPSASDINLPGAAAPAEAATPEQLKSAEGRFGGDTFDPLVAPPPMAPPDIPPTPGADPYGNAPKGWYDPTNHAQFQTVADAAAEKYGIPQPIMNSLIYVESGWNPTRVSSAKAEGIVQLKPGTAKEMGVTNSFAPAQAIEGGAKYLAQQYAKFGSWDKALAAYNAGPGNIRAGAGYAQTVLAYARLGSGSYGGFATGKPPDQNGKAAGKRASNALGRAQGG